MEVWIEQIKVYIYDYFGNSSIIIYLYIGCLIYLCFCGKRSRRLIVYPSMIMTLIIINPVLYGLIWAKLVAYAFWRMLWMIPIIPVIVCAVLNIDYYIKSRWSTITLMFLLSLGISRKFENIYGMDNMYVKVSNPYKLPDSTIEIGKVILEYDNEPIIIAPASQYCYLRQYSGDIKQVFGRNAEGYIGIFNSNIVWWELIYYTANNGGDIARYVELANLFGAEIIVLPDEHTFESIDNYGYENIANYFGYVIYLKKGKHGV